MYFNSQLEAIGKFIEEKIWHEPVNEFIGLHGNNINAPPRHCGHGAYMTIASLHITNNAIEKCLDDMILELVALSCEERFCKKLQEYHLDSLARKCQLLFDYRKADESEKKRLNKPMIGRLIGRQTNVFLYHVPGILESMLGSEELRRPSWWILFATLRVFLLSLRHMIFLLKQQRPGPGQDCLTYEEFSMREKQLLAEYQHYATVVLVCLTGPLSRLSRKKEKYLGSECFVELICIAPLKWKELIQIGLTPAAACEQITERTNLTLKEVQTNNKRDGLRNHTSQKTTTMVALTMLSRCLGFDSYTKETKITSPLSGSMVMPFRNGDHICKSCHLNGYPDKNKVHELCEVCNAYPDLFQNISKTVRFPSDLSEKL